MADRTQRRILVTRPEPGLSETLNILSQLGWPTQAAPMLRIQHTELRGAASFDRIIVTSGQSLESLCNRIAQDTPLTAVGARTAERARALGFTQVDAAQGTAESLIAHLGRAGRTECGDSSLLLATGSGLGIGLARTLRDLGWQVTRRVVYRTQPIAILDRETHLALNSREIDAVLFYSSATATAFLNALGPERSVLATIRALVLSPQVSQALTRSDWKTVSVAAFPDQTALLDLLGPSPATSSE